MWGGGVGVARKKKNKKAINSANTWNGKSREGVFSFFHSCSHPQVEEVLEQMHYGLTFKQAGSPRQAIIYKNNIPFSKQKHLGSKEVKIPQKIKNGF